MQSLLFCSPACKKNKKNPKHKGSDCSWLFTEDATFFTKMWKHGTHILSKAQNSTQMKIYKIQILKKKNKLNDCWNLQDNVLRKTKYMKKKEQRSDDVFSEVSALRYFRAITCRIEHNDVYFLLD